MRSRGMGRGWAVLALVAMVGVGGACEGTHEVDQSDGASVLDVSGDGWGDVDEWVDTTPDTRVDLDGVDSDGAIGVDAGDGTADDSIADDGSAPDSDTRDVSVSSDASDAAGTDDADARDASGTNDASDASGTDDADARDASDVSSDVATDAGVDTVVPAPREPLVAYVQGGARALYFLNNPE
ncbi:MAG: hypothetical protein JNJ59_03410, partial [Deltaproteobacteria bacterium]|nr:hypothetical protein [Deltaproteobacteria bacterium]